jgi:hypothetical protein
VSETPSGRVTDPKKVNAIKSMLSLPEYTGGEGAAAAHVSQNTMCMRTRCCILRQC